MNTIKGSLFVAVLLGKWLGCDTDQQFYSVPPFAASIICEGMLTFCYALTLVPAAIAWLRERHCRFEPQI